MANQHRLPIVADSLCLFLTDFNFHAQQPQHEMLSILYCCKFVLYELINQPSQSMPIASLAPYVFPNYKSVTITKLIFSLMFNYLQCIINLIFPHVFALITAIIYNIISLLNSIKLQIVLHLRITLLMKFMCLSSINECKYCI